MSRPTSLTLAELRAVVRVLEQARHGRDRREPINLSETEWAAIDRAEGKMRERLAGDAEEPRS